MTFEEKLGSLMEISGTSNIRLAKAINVDPSLVSKWRNAKRPLARNSPYISLIADYFLGTDAPRFQRERLLDILRSDYPDVDTFSRPVLKRALMEWLSSADTASPESDGKHEQDTASVGKLISAFDHFAAGPNVGITPFSGNIPVQRPGKPGYFESFKGIEGRRQVVINFLSMVLSSPKPLELFLSSEEDIEWLIGDMTFFLRWGEMLREAIARGHQIHIVHRVNRDLSRIMAVMGQWIPLHLTGRVQSYYYPKYREPGLQTTMFIAQGLAAVLAVTPGGSDKGATDYSLLFTDPVAIRLIEANFLSFLSTCRPLSKTFLPDAMADYGEEMARIEQRLGAEFSLRDSLSSLTMPPSLFVRLLDRLSLTADQKEARIQIHEERTEAFLQNLRHFRHTAVCTCDVTDLVFRPTLNYKALDFYCDLPVPCRAEEYAEHLSHLIALLTRYDNLNLFFTGNKKDNSLSHVHLSVKEGGAAMMARCDQSGANPVAVITYEDNIVQAFKEYFRDLIDDIPSVRRDKATTVERLDEQVNVMRKQY